MKKIILSLSLIAAITAGVFFTNAYLSDTEAAAGNTFAAGTIDLKIDNESYYNGVLNPGTSWQTKNLKTGDFFFDFHDLKPGDYGEDTISLIVNDNPAWACLAMAITKDDDNITLRPEIKAGDTPDDPNNLFDGELSRAVNIVFWSDPNGDNIHQANETIITQGKVKDVLSTAWPLADSQKNYLGDVDGEPMAGNKTYHIAKFWCFGEIKQSTNGEFTCDGNAGNIDNLTQTDLMMANVKFSALQERHNSAFVCPTSGIIWTEPEPPAPEQPKPIDLELTKTVDNQAPQVGDNIKFTLNLVNKGASNASGVTVADAIPAGLSYVSDNGGGSFVSGVWTIGALASSASASLEITAKVDTAGAIINTAEVATANEQDIDSTPGNHNPQEDDQSAATINATVPPKADLQLYKNLDYGYYEGPLLVGDQIIYSLDVYNNGPDTATGITVSDLLPADLSYVSHGGSGSYDPLTGVWMPGNLPADNGAYLSITVKITQASSITNTAEIMASGAIDPDSTPGNHNPGEDDQSAATIYPALPYIDLELYKAVNNPAPAVGELITYYLDINNDGNTWASGVTVADILPTGVSYFSDNGGGSYDPVTGIWTVGQLPPGWGPSVSLQITAQVDSAGTIVNTAEVATANEHDIDSTPANGNPSEDDQSSAAITAVIPTADLELTQTATSTNPLAPIACVDPVTYTIKVTNKGPVTTTNIQIKNTLPFPLAYKSHTASAGSYTSGTRIWSIPTLASGATATLAISVNTCAVITTKLYADTAEVTASDLPDPDSTPNNHLTSEDDYTSASITIVTGAPGPPPGP